MFCILLASFLWQNEQQKESSRRQIMCWTPPVAFTSEAPSVAWTAGLTRFPSSFGVLLSVCGTVSIQRCVWCSRSCDREESGRMFLSGVHRGVCLCARRVCVCVDRSWKLSKGDMLRWGEVLVVFQCVCVLVWKWFTGHVFRLIVCVRLCLLGCVEALFHPTTRVQTSCQSVCATPPPADHFTAQTQTKNTYTNKYLNRL